MTLKSPLSVASMAPGYPFSSPALRGYLASEIQQALAYAVNAALTTPTDDRLKYLPQKVDEALIFEPHPWVLAAICEAMRGVLEGTQPVLGQPTARFTPTTKVPENVALVAEGRDLGFITEDRLTARSLSIEQPYARAVIKVLDSTVQAAYALQNKKLFPDPQEQNHA